MESSFARHVWAAARHIPRGKVTTYGRLARSIGHPGAARAVGRALSINPEPAFAERPHARVTPCHRVVCSHGELGGYAGGSKKKRALLKHEGVEFIGKKVNPHSIIDLGFISA